MLWQGWRVSGMKWIKRILISIVLLVVVAFGSLFFMVLPIVRVRQQDTIVATAAGIPRVRKLAIAQAGRMVIMRAIARVKPKDIPKVMMKDLMKVWKLGWDMVIR